jgi:hypothetical protein
VAGDPLRIDRRRLVQLLNVAGPDGRAELLRRLESDLSRAASAMEQALATCDSPRLRAETHILISLTGAVGAEGLHDVMQRMNAAAHHELCPELDRLAPQALRGLDILLSEIRRQAGGALAVAGA